MVIVKKENRVLNVDELEKDAYKADGYDVVVVKDGAYIVAEPATGGRLYTIEEYQAVVAERDAAVAELAKVKAKKSAKAEDK